MGTRQGYPTGWLGRLYRMGSFGVEVGDGGRQRRSAARQAEAFEYFLRRIRWVDFGRNFHRAATTLTLKNVHQENSHHHESPGIVAASRRIILFSVTSL